MARMWTLPIGAALLCLPLWGCPDAVPVLEGTGASTGTSTCKCADILTLVESGMPPPCTDNPLWNGLVSCLCDTTSTCGSLCGGPSCPPPNNPMCLTCPSCQNAYQLCMADMMADM
jgi:hypothetical protein